MPWSSLGSFRRISPNADVTPKSGQLRRCGDSSSRLVRCTVGVDEGTRIRLTPLDGSKSLPSEERCAYLDPAVRTFGIAWTDRMTARGCRVEQRTTSGG